MATPEKRPIGRPRIIGSPEEFEKRANAYFSKCEEGDEPVTVTGLALAVGLSSRDGLVECGKRPEFADAVKRAKARVERAYERRLSGNSPAGAIFALKNMGWSDRQDIAMSGSLEIISQAQRDAAVKAATG